MCPCRLARIISSGPANPHHEAQPAESQRLVTSPSPDYNSLNITAVAGLFMYAIQGYDRCSMCFDVPGAY